MIFLKRTNSSMMNFLETLLEMNFAMSHVVLK